MAAPDHSAPEPDAITQAFAETYRLRAYSDPWQAVLDYQRVMDYQAEHPNAGRGKVGNALELPPSRVRGWLNGGMPDVVRGYHTALDHDWLPFDPEAEMGRALNVLCAWIYSAGSIDAAAYQPLFTASDDDERERLDQAGQQAGVRWATSRANEPGRADEYRPEQDVSVLGRVLVALGAPAGTKNPDATIALPDYLPDAPEKLRQAFVATYLRNRAVEDSKDGTNRIRLREERSEQYLQSLASLFEAVLGGDVWLTDKNVVLSTPATEAYRDLPDPLTEE